jgi:hypothetical protein
MKLNPKPHKIVTDDENPERTNTIQQLFSLLDFSSTKQVLRIGFAWQTKAAHTSLDYRA